MELLVATWTVRLTLVGMLATGWITYSAGMGLLDVAIRVAVVAVALLFAGRLALGWLETPDQKLARMHARRARERGDA